MAVTQRKNANKKSSDSKEAAKVPKDEALPKRSSVEPQPYVNFKMPWGKIVTRFALSMLMVFAVYWNSKKDTEHVFASQKQKIQILTAEAPCADSYKKDVSQFKDCAPKQCGRLVTDIVVSAEEASHLLRVCKKGLAFGGSNGGASILDLHSGALSEGNAFTNIYKKLKTSSANNVFTEDDFKVYRNVRKKIQQVISYNFGVPVNKLYLTHPTFFSEMTARSAKTVHDEYWHIHVDKQTYPSFHYTSLLYLTDYGIDFSGGRFIFVDDKLNTTVEPRLGRVSAFTSGAENPHYVERVSSGVRYAMTVSFTCDPEYAIKDPTMEKFQ